MMRAPDGYVRAVPDTVYCDQPRLVVPCRCECCQKCWLVVQGKGVGKCVNGGPYLGYVAITNDE